MELLKDLALVAPAYIAKNTLAFKKNSSGLFDSWSIKTIKF